MKHFYILLFTLLLLQLNFFAQTKWHKYAGNPVLEKGEAGEWDEANIYSPYVLWNGTNYIMYYANEGENEAIGYATSSDGINWTKDVINNPVLEKGTTGSWDAGGVSPGPVLFDGTLYKMWYNSGESIGLATSSDGIDWTKDTINNPVITKGLPGEWDADRFICSNIIYENSPYKMWYSGAALNNDLGAYVFKIGYATSTDGIDWNKHPEPVMEEGDFITWANDLLGSFVMNDGSQYMMWYCSINTNLPKNGQINCATSPDGLEWTLFVDNPVLHPGHNSWDGTNVVEPIVIKENKLFKMWYTGEFTPQLPNFVRSIGYAEDFSNLVHADTVFIEEIYINPYTDTLNVLGRVISPEGHAVEAKAFLISDDESIQDSVELFDDGLNGDGDADDGIYGAYKTVSGEKNYTVGIRTIDQATGFTRNGLDWNITDRFTAKGPIEFVSVDYTTQDTVGVPGERITFNLTLKNNGLTDTIHKVEANLLLYNYPIRNTGFGTPTFGDIAPGENKINSGASFALTPNDSATAGSYEIGLEISSNGEVFWIDSFLFDIVVGIEDELSALLENYALKQNYPNPFNPVTRIEYQIPELSFVTLKVFDVLGKEIKTLVNEEKPAGIYEVEFNATEYRSGIYFYRLQAGDYIETKKMLLLR